MTTLQPIHVLPLTVKLKDIYLKKKVVKLKLLTNYSKMNGGAVAVYHLAQQRSLFPSFRLGHWVWVHAQYPHLAPGLGASLLFFSKRLVRPVDRPWQLSGDAGVPLTV